MTTTPYFLDQNLRADSAAGSPGNSWIDHDGLTFKVSGLSLVGDAGALDTTGEGRVKRCLRAKAENYPISLALLAHIQSPINDAGLFFRHDEATGIGYSFRMVGTSGYILFNYFSGYGVAPTQLGIVNIAASFGLREYILVLLCFNSSGSNVRMIGKVFDGGTTGFPQVGSTLTVNDSSGSAILTSGGVGWHTGNSINTGLNRFQAFTYDGSNDPALVTSLLPTTGQVFMKPGIDATTKAPNGISAWNLWKPVHGTFPVDVQLKRATGIGGSYSNIGSAVHLTTPGGYQSGTQMTLADATASPATEYAYGFDVTDAVGSVASIHGLSFITPAAPVAGLATEADSLLGGSDWKPSPRPAGGFNPNQCTAVEMALRATNAAGTGRGVATVNFATGGYTIDNSLADLNNAGSGKAIGDMTAYFTASGIAASKWFCLCQWGVNDAGVAQHANQNDFLTTLDSVCTLLIANGVIPVLNYCPWDDIGGPDPTLETNYRRRHDYNVAVDTVLGRSYPALGGGNKSPQAGTKLLWRWGRLHRPEWNPDAGVMNDGTHPTGVVLCGEVGAYTSVLIGLGD